MWLRVKMQSPDPYPEPTGRSIPPIHTKTQAGDPDRSIRLDHHGPIHTRILTQLCVYIYICDYTYTIIYIYDIYFIVFICIMI